MAARLIRVFREEADAATELREGEKLYSVLRDGTLYFTPARNPQCARADVSAYLDDEVAPVDQHRATAASVANAILKLTPEERAKLRDLVN
jgi:hypothetical protein